ncbi:MAG: NAD-dependent epimerase/dehydratase family protein [Chitinophagaceae bacterium]
MKVRPIITGATGMVGEGVLHECLLHPDVEKVLVINRRPCGVTHPKLTEIIHQDFMDWSGVKADFKEYNACFFCLGISSVGVKPDDYYRMTYDLTMQVANTLVKANNDMVFCYVSGAGTDSTENGKVRWARVKGKTENDLMKLPFKRSYMFRPGFLKPTPGLKNTLSLYKYIGWLFPIMRGISKKSASTLREIGLAMINTVRVGYDKQILDGNDIYVCAEKQS